MANDHENHALYPMKLLMTVLSKRVITGPMYEKHLSRIGEPSSIDTLRPYSMESFYASDMTAIWNKMTGNMPGIPWCLSNTPSPVKTVSAEGGDGKLV